MTGERVLHDLGGLGEVLDYLADLGYDELLLPRGAGGPADAVRRAPAAAARAAEPAPGPEAPPVPAHPPAAPGAWPNLAELGAHVAACTRCALAAGRATVVFGSGSPAAELMLVGEGPGAEEDRRGLPFVGPAGELLTKMLAAIGRRRDEVYIANVVKCRPPGNRDPEPAEVAACLGYLEAQIGLVRPRVLVALGRVAAQTLLGADLPVGRMRGAWHRFRGIDLRVTYHPAALLRNAALKRPTWEDLQVVRDRLDRTGP